MNKTFTILTVLLFAAGSIFAQEGDKPFKPSGKPFIKVFSNFHSTFEDDHNFNAFEIKRAYFGYGVKLTEKISGKVTLDVGNPKAGGLELTAFLKNAYFQYKSNGLTVKFGMIGLHQFKLQETLWGGRYLYKSFMDEHKFGPSADLGVFASYKFNEKISADVTIANGEGYKKIEADSVFKYSGGITITPIEKLNFRASYDYMGSDSAQQTLAFYAGYEVGNFKVGAEYNQHLNHKMNDKNDLTGLSFYGSYKIEKTRVFARYDDLSSVKIDDAENPWNHGKDGSAIIGGVEFNVAKGLKLTPNYQGWMPADGSATIHSIFLNCEIKL